MKTREINGGGGSLRTVSGSEMVTLRQAGAILTINTYTSMSRMKHMVVAQKLLVRISAPPYANPGQQVLLKTDARIKSGHRGRRDHRGRGGRATVKMTDMSVRARFDYSQ